MIVYYFSIDLGKFLNGSNSACSHETPFSRIRKPKIITVSGSSMYCTVLVYQDEDNTVRIINTTNIIIIRKFHGMRSRKRRSNHNDFF